MTRHKFEESGARSLHLDREYWGSDYSGSRRLTLDSRPFARGFTLVEMLVAMAITLVMMGAVVTLFANVSNSVRNRRAVIELSGQMRHVRNLLQQDLQGATCPGFTWQRPEHNRGYIEIIEGPYRDMNPSILTDGSISTANPELDPKLSTVPRNNVVGDYNNNGRIDDDDRRVHLQRRNSLTVRQNPNGPDDDTNPVVAIGNGLGDHDDTLMLTVRNEHEPFVGRAPANVRLNQNTAERFDVDPNTTSWSYESIESPLAEVVWYAVENPVRDADADGQNDTGNFFGQPGMRTIYRRALLIAPWLNPYRYTDSNGNHDTFTYDGDSFVAQPGLLRILPDSIDEDRVDLALACLIAFQDRYDISARLEFDPVFGSDGRWKIVANTLGDLTKRENRYEHHFYRPAATAPRVVAREFPFAVESVGYGYSGTMADVALVEDPEVVATSGTPSQAARAQANLAALPGLTGKSVLSYSIDPLNLTTPQRRYAARPLAYVDQESASVATARPMLNDDGEVVRVVRGLVPLSRDRRGEDVILTNALAFDLRVYDPGAPLFGVREIPGSSTNTNLLVVLEPSDPGWYTAYNSTDNMNDTGSGPSGKIGDDFQHYPFVRQGAYVDLGYGLDTRPGAFTSAAPDFNSSISYSVPWFFQPRALSDVYLDSRPATDVVFSQLAPGYAVYDTWSFHYENDGLNEDRFRYNGAIWQPVDDDPNTGQQFDEGTNGFDDVGSYSDTYAPGTDNPRLGIDDVGERETAPPYDRPLRGIEVILRGYETDSRQIRQLSVKQHFVPE